MSLIQHYFVTEVGVEGRRLWATNHGVDPFEGAVEIDAHQIVAVVSRENGKLTLARNKAMPGATGETWIADIFLSNGDHIWLYDDGFEVANSMMDAWVEIGRAR